MPNVLFATPHNRLQPETIRAVFTQTYTGHRDHFFTCRNEIPAPGENIIAAYQRIQAVFRAEPAYTHLFIVENDLIIPPDALERLLAVEADISYGTYCFRRGSPVVNVMHKDTTDPLTGYPELWAKAWGRVTDCAGLGFGCTLIRRHVLQRFDLRSDYGGGDADTCLAQDAKKAGLTQRADLGLLCGHITPNDTVLWPAARRPFYIRRGENKPNLATVCAILPVAVWDENKVPLVLRPGQEGRIDAELAQNMVARGQVRYVPGEFKDYLSQ